MSDHEHAGSLMRRVIAEHRRVIYPLVAILVINVVVYAAGVYPLAQRVANIEQRDRAAEQGLAQARREHEAASGALTGKERATVELATFYKDVLPRDFQGARRLTYLRLAQLAREAGLRSKTITYDVRNEPKSTLERVQIDIALEGSYDGMRAFIYQLDTAAEFVVIDDISLADQAGNQNGLRLTMELSTYYSKAPGP
jgi:Tfp pilus assembly protein PilO